MRWIALDLETTNQSYGRAIIPDNRIVAASWYVGIDRRIIKRRVHYGSLESCKAFWKHLHQAELVIAHNGKFEAHWLARLGCDITKLRWYDTMLAEWVLLGNNPKGMQFELGAVAERYGVGSKRAGFAAALKAGKCPSELPMLDVLARCYKDVELTVLVAMRQRDELKSSGKAALAKARFELMPVLAEIERNGITLDAEKVLTAHADYVRRGAEIAASLDKFTGGINLNSPKQLAEFIYDKLGLPAPERLTATGRRKTDNATLESVAKHATTKEQKQFFSLRSEQRKLSSALSKSLDFFKGVVDERQCKFYAELMQCRTATHRLSGRGVPLQFAQFSGLKSCQPQNMPREFKYLQRSSDPNYVLVELDAVQLEFYVAVGLSGDKQGLADINNPDFDVHLQTLSILSGKDYAELLAAYRSGYKKVEAQRTAAKPSTFKPLYGGEKGTAKEEKYFKWFRQHYAGIYDMQCGWLRQAEATGKVSMPTGMEFFWPDLEYKHGTAFRKGKPIKASVFNYPIQYLATGEIIPLALMGVYNKTSKLRVRITNTVHDSIFAEVHRSDLEQYKAACCAVFSEIDIMLKTRYNVNWTLPIKCEFKTIGGK